MSHFRNPTRFLIYIILVGVSCFVLFGCSSTPTPVSGIVPSIGIPISIPQDLYHQVGPAETLWRISKMYGVSIQSITQANHLKDPRSIEIGQKLLIPRASEIRPIIPVYNTR